MANFTLFVASTTARTLADGEFGFIGQLGALATSGTAVAASGDSSVSVLGSLFSANGAAIDHDGSRLELYVGPGASVGSAARDTVAGDFTDSAFVSNDGFVFSDSDALDLRTSDDGAAIAIFNTGTLSGVSDGVVTASGEDDTRIVNTGKITGGDGGIDHLTGDAVVINHGEIVGRLYGYDGAADVDVLRNSGRIEGGVFMQAGDDFVRNRGLIDEVDLGDGDDDFEGLGGEVAGTVQGGRGDDTVRGGTGEDDLRGGSGGDILRGRAGDDALRGGSGVDVINGGKGDDVIYGGGGADLFRFSAGDGYDIISDLGPSDQIDLSPIGLASFGSAVKPFIEDVAGGAVIDLSEDFGLRIFVEDTNAGQLKAGDFLI